MANVYYTVKKGDTLSAIASKYKTTVSAIAKKNNISNVNLIYVGQKLLISGTTSSSSNTGSSNSTKAKITAFGLQANTDRTIFATWSWSKSNTDHYKADWGYGTNQGIWFDGDDTDVNVKQSIYNAPQNATKVRFRVKPIAKKHKVNGKETSYWTANWTDWKIYNFSNNPPAETGTPDINWKDDQVTITLDNLDSSIVKVRFQVIVDDVKALSIKTVDVVRGHVSFTYDTEAGHKYKVRTQSVNKNGDYGPWSDYSGNVETGPSAPGDITVCRATSATSVHLEWSAATGAKTYDLQYTTKREYFDGSNQITTVNSIEGTSYDLTGLESGQEYFFRVRAVNDQGNSSWSSISSVIIGKDPAAPTTWSSTTTVITGEDLILYWVHNTEDGSSQVRAELEVYFDDVKETYVIDNTTDEDEKDKTSNYVIDTSGYLEGVKIKWRVRTMGITGNYGDWSVQRTVNVYARPTLALMATDIDGATIETLTTFPLYIAGTAGPKTQTPIAYHLTVISNESYETVDQIGNTKMVREGDEVYSKYFDISDDLVVELSANNIDLENGVSYTVKCLVTMNSGLSAEDTVIFNVSWTDEMYEPNAEINIDYDDYSASIKPYCERYPMIYYKVDYLRGLYFKTTEVIDEIEGTSIDDAYTTTDEIVYTATTEEGEEILFCMVESEEGIPIEGIMLSVYRREYDGSFVEIGKGIDSMNPSFVLDPHPSLDFARYRIVATTVSTGAVSYYDMPGYPINGIAAIIQWDEIWSNFEVNPDDPGDELSNPPWSGSLLELPYNIDVSDKHNVDVALVEYIGREHPVTYYGTQLGKTSTWNMDVPKNDKDTLYGLRRLAKWTGDVYVREPSGSGYWANISVSFSQKHLDVVIPVSLDITRVEGGV